ncbi:hypothetical protein MtrunA17_Chr2g0318021 [Medicago truncatula]|uniref:Transmembrane protein n=1 Tax=Medicago truncatula TaxID=3880 RepID=A0A396JAG1_MEDTR|nr:hypothetical protein MtrunA17_Chr2g0318021 [Medicago truncatula]
MMSNNLEAIECELKKMRRECNWIYVLYCSVLCSMAFLCSYKVHF